MAWENPITTWGQAGQTVPGVDDFNRIEGNIEVLGKYDRSPGYGVAIGTNTKSITLHPVPASYYDGMCFAFKNSTENTGAVTINVNGLGAKSVKKPNGNDLVAGNLKAGSVYTVRYNGTNFILQGEGGEYGNATPADVREGVSFGTEEGIKIGTLEMIESDVSDDILFYYSNDVFRNNFASGTKRRHVTLKVVVNGLYRISFHLYNQYDHLSEAQIYKNGQPYGTLRSATGKTGQTFIEDLYFQKGDTIELWTTNVSGILLLDQFKVFSTIGPEIIQYSTD